MGTGRGQGVLEGMTGVGALLQQRRPRRADAARHFDDVIEAARTVFLEDGPNVPLEEIARRAGVGVATLYRNFPSRDDLVEAVYVTEIDALCRAAMELLETEQPWQAVEAWIRRFVTYMATKRVLLDVLDRDSGTYGACRAALYASAEPLLTRAQEAGHARPELSIDDVLRFVFGVTGTPVTSAEQRGRLLAMIMNAIRVTDRALGTSCSESYSRSVSGSG